MNHFRCRGEFYARENVKRYIVEDTEVPWSIPLPDYKPTNFTSEKILNLEITDPDLLSGCDKEIKFNEIDNVLNRKSFMGNYEVVDGIPRNPIGRTGIIGRGVLYYWGPNHAADPIVTTWKRNEDGSKSLHPDTGKPILKFVAIYRRHDHEWAIPGGMVDRAEDPFVAMKREFSEEALNVLVKTETEQKELLEKINHMFINGQLIYQGYVDDPRNTDNAWMETVAMNFHDEEGDSLARISLEAGDDASAIKWIELGRDLKLYASHLRILDLVVSMHDAHW